MCLIRSYGGSALAYRHSALCSREYDCGDLGIWVKELISMRQYRLCLVFRRTSIYREVVKQHCDRGCRGGTTLVDKSAAGLLSSGRPAGQSLSIQHHRLSLILPAPILGGRRFRAGATLSSRFIEASPPDAVGIPVPAARCRYWLVCLRYLSRKSLLARDLKLSGAWHLQ